MINAKPGAAHETAERLRIALHRWHQRVARRSEQRAQRHNGVATRMQPIQNVRKRFDGLRAVAARVMQKDDAAIVSLLFDSSQDDVCPRLRPILWIDILQDHEIIEVFRDFQQGLRARQLGELAGVSIPLQAAEHYYLLTEPIEGVDGDWPVLEDPASFGYYREEGGGLMLGMFEPVCAPWRVDGVPENFSFGELPPDWDRMAPYLETTMSRIPVAAKVGIRKFFCGPESFTPDLLPIVGEAPELKNGSSVAAGLNSIGILTGGGIGRTIAQWIVGGSPDIDITAINIDRLHPYQANPEYRATRTVESLGLVYSCHYPNRPTRTARGARRSPIHHRLVAERACFRDVSGWEGADWYAPAGVEPETGELSWGRPHWFGYWESEHHATRNGVIAMDMSFMAKFLLDLGRGGADDAGRRHGHVLWARGRRASSSLRCRTISLSSASG